MTAPVVVDDWDGPAEVLPAEGGWSLRPVPPDVVLAPGYALEFNVTLNPDDVHAAPRTARYRIRPMRGLRAWYLRWRYPA